jgi:uncharacterized protein YkwD
MTARIRGSVCAVVAALGLAAGAQAVVSGLSGQDQWLIRFNRERARSGAPPFRLLPVLDQVAQQQAEEMARGGRPPSTETVSESLRRAGYSAHDWREDFLVSPAESEAMLLTRKASREIQDGRFRDLGIGTAEAPGGGTFYVFLFGWHEGDYFASATARLADHERVADEMLKKVNDARWRAGLAPLVRNPLLDRVSQEHADDMLARSYFGHQTPEGLGPSDRARADGYRPGIGENLVEARFSVDDALDAWMNSRDHRRNILDPGCRELGVGLAIGAGYDAAPGGYRVIWVQSFGRGE